jgi:hypothetical protein
MWRIKCIRSGGKLVGGTGRQMHSLAGHFNFKDSVHVNAHTHACQEAGRSLLESGERNEGRQARR